MAPCAGRVRRTRVTSVAPGGRLSPMTEPPGVCRSRSTPRSRPQRASRSSPSAYGTRSRSPARLPSRTVFLARCSHRGDMACPNRAGRPTDTLASLTRTTNSRSATPVESPGATPVPTVRGFHGTHQMLRTLRTLRRRRTRSNSSPFRPPRPVRRTRWTTRSPRCRITGRRRTRSVPRSVPRAARRNPAASYPGDRQPMDRILTERRPVSRTRVERVPADRRPVSRVRLRRRSHRG